MDICQNHRLSQTLAVTPQLCEAISLLQLSAIELNEFVEREVQENPLLEWESRDPSTHWDDHVQRLPATQSLESYLQTQLDILLTDPVEKEIGQILLQSLTSEGYLDKEPSAIALMVGAPLDIVLKTLEKAQQCEPVGIFARDLKDCLKIQLQDRGLYTPSLARSLENMAAFSPADVRVLRTLHLRPAQIFEENRPQTLIADVLLVKRGENYMVELNPEVLSQVYKNSDYYFALSRQLKNPQDLCYLRGRFKRASWLMNALQQRAVTLLAVSQEIMRYQRSFFEEGVKALRPLILKDIAQALGIHESTVSRVTAEKFIATPRGTLPLKYFFGGGCAETVTTKAVQERVRRLIHQEPANHPLSDQHLVAALQQEGIQVARRTITKYRESLAIPSSVDRRRQYVVACSGT